MSNKSNILKSSKEKSKRTIKHFRPFRALVKFFKDPRLHKIIGVLLFLVIPIFFLVAFTSFLFTWQRDFSVLDRSWWGLLLNSEINVENWLGKIGAFISYLFIYKWFGIASFVFIFLSFVLGFRIVFHSSIVSIPKSLAYSLFILIWLPTTMAFISYVKDKSPTPSELVLSGYFGFFINNWLISALGLIGTGVSLFFILICFLIINNISLFRILKKPQPSDDSLDKQEENTFISLPEEISDERHDIKLKNNGAKETKLEITNLSEEQVEEYDLDSKINVYDPKDELPDYHFPPLSLLEEHGSDTINIDKDELESNKDRIVRTLANYGISIDKIKATVGPTVTLYEIIPSPGIRISKIKGLEDDIALSLAALGIRIIAPMPGKGTIGIEVPNRNPEIVSILSILSSDKFQKSNMELPVALGKTISNEVFIADLVKMPHLLIAGATGQGKSVGINDVLASLLYKKHPSQIKFVLVDPKKVELSFYSKLERHFLAKLPNTEDPIITDTKKVIHTLNSLCILMEQRTELLKDAEVRNIIEYNDKFINKKLSPNEGHQFMPYIILVVDEFADLIMTAGKEVEIPLTRIAQLGRAVGIHLIIATQRPSVNIITGTIKANFPVRIAYKVSAKVDSRTIIDSNGAEQLVGRGDMLILIGSNLIRLQSAYIDTSEVEKITEFIGSQRGYPDAYILPEYIEDVERVADFDPLQHDPMFEDAARLIVLHQQGSTSLIQRKMKLGYNRAGRIMDQLESAGIVGPFEGSKARRVLITDLQTLEQKLKEMQ